MYRPLRLETIQASTACYSDSFALLLLLLSLLLPSYLWKACHFSRYTVIINVIGHSCAVTQCRRLCVASNAIRHHMPACQFMGSQLTAGQQNVTDYFRLDILSLCVLNVTWLRSIVTHFSKISYGMPLPPHMLLASPILL
jgi:hypothetical protein